MFLTFVIASFQSRFRAFAERKITRESFEANAAQKTTEGDPVKNQEKITRVFGEFVELATKFHKKQK